MSATVARARPRGVRGDLTGLGERAHLAMSTTNLDTHIQDVLNVLEYEDLHDVVLRAHSYGGMVATGVADHAAHRLSTLIYLDAQIPRGGESLWSLTTGSERRRFLASSRDGVLTDPPPRPRPTHDTAAPGELPAADHARRWRDTRAPRGLRVHGRLAEQPAGRHVRPRCRRSRRHTEMWSTGHDIVGEACAACVELLLREDHHRNNPQ